MATTLHLDSQDNRIARFWPSGFPLQEWALILNACAFRIFRFMTIAPFITTARSKNDTIECIQPTCR
jgi:hypothetical protein